MNSNELQDYLDFSLKTLTKAGKILLDYRDSFQIKKTKDPLSLDIATSADYAAEESIVKDITSAYPGHSIMTEETEGLTRKSDYEWIIDPLDGTKEYVRHSPYFYTLLALEKKGRLVMGAGYQPQVGRIFAGAIGIGAFMDGHKIVLSPQDKLEKSLISVALPVYKMNHLLLTPYLHLVEALTYSCYRLRNTPWDVEAIFNVSFGLVEGYVMPPQESGHGPKWWDIASGIAVLEANGGKITDFYGHPYKQKDTTKGIVATNGKIHDELLKTIALYYR